MISHILEQLDRGTKYAGTLAEKVIALRLWNPSNSERQRSVWRPMSAAWNTRPRPPLPTEVRLVWRRSKDRPSGRRSICESA